MRINISTSFSEVSTPTEVQPLLEACYHPGLSLDCVIFGFHDKQLKVLLMQTSYQQQWMLVGGFVPKTEGVNAAAIRVLRARTGLTRIYLRQFQLFGDADRNAQRATILAEEEKSPAERARQQWLASRFVTVGYYAMIDYTKVQPVSADFPLACAWWDLGSLPPMILDHRCIVEAALVVLRERLRFEPVGYDLLPEKFTMPELQKLYEAILDRPLDRRNFQRRMLSYGILTALDETRHLGGSHKAPRLYSFDAPKYQQAMEQGLSDAW